jgi:hypothetical protein
MSKRANVGMALTMVGAIFAAAGCASRVQQEPVAVAQPVEAEPTAQQTEPRMSALTLTME